MYFLGLILAFLWPKVPKNPGVPKIHVFLELILAFLLPKVPKNYGVPKICVFLGLILVFLWPKVPKNYGILEIRVFLGLIFGISLAQGAEELWRSQNSCLSGADFWHFSGPKCQRIMAFPKFVSFCIQKRSNFMVWVSFLAGLVN